MKKLAIALAAASVAFACGPKHEVESRATAAAITPVTCIAVLPFENLSADPAAGEGMADVLATELLKSGRFQVMDRSESARILASRGIYLTATSDPGQIRALGDVLGVQAIVMGSVSEWAYRSSSFGDRPDRPVIGVATRLVDVRTGSPLWGARFAGSPASFFDAATPPMTAAAQRVAADITGGLVEDAGQVNPPEKPCWESKAQSVLATLAPGASGGPSRAATPIVAATPAPTPTATVVAMATPEPTPAPTPVAIKLTASQTALRDKLKPASQFQLDGVAFQAMTTNLADTSNAVLGDLAAVLVAHPEIRLRIEAHVDPTDPGPVPLSQKRAEAVVAKLVSVGANASQLEPKGMGGSKSLFPSFVEAMKLKNRRVEVAVLAGPNVGGGASDAGSAAGGAAATNAAGNARVKVLASKGAQASAVKLANALKQNGTNVVTVASVPEARAKTLVYFMPKFETQATALAKTLQVPGGARLAKSQTLGKGVDIVILVGTDLK